MWLLLNERCGIRVCSTDPVKLVAKPGHQSLIKRRARGPSRAPSCIRCRDRDCNRRPPAHSASKQVAAVETDLSARVTVRAALGTTTSGAAANVPVGRTAPHRSLGPAASRALTHVQPAQGVNHDVELLDVRRIRTELREESGSAPLRRETVSPSTPTPSRARAQAAA